MPAERARGFHDGQKDNRRADYSAEVRLIDVGVLLEWGEILGQVASRKIQIYAHANNRYAGHAPFTMEMFRDLWRNQVATEAGARSKVTVQGQLFK